MNVCDTYDNGLSQIRLDYYRIAYEIGRILNIYAEINTLYKSCIHKSRDITKHFV